MNRGEGGGGGTGFIFDSRDTNVSYVSSEFKLNHVFDGPVNWLLTEENATWFRQSSKCHVNDSGSKFSCAIIHMQYSKCEEAQCEQ